MRGVYQGVECRTGEVRIDGKMEKALIYADREGENDVQALCAAGFADLVSIVLFILAAAFVAFYFLTRKISAFKKEPEYPNYPYDGSEDTDE